MGSPPNQHKNPPHSIMALFIKVRTNAGTYRVGGIDPSISTPADILTNFPTTSSDAFRPCRVDGMFINSPLCSDSKCNMPLNERKTLLSQGVYNGGLVYCTVAFHHPQPPPDPSMWTRMYTNAVATSTVRNTTTPTVGVRDVAAKVTVTGINNKINNKIAKKQGGKQRGGGEIISLLDDDDDDDDDDIVIVSRRPASRKREYNFN